MLVLANVIAVLELENFSKQNGKEKSFIKLESAVCQLECKFSPVQALCDCKVQNGYVLYLPLMSRNKRS